MWKRGRRSSKVDCVEKTAVLHVLSTVVPKGLRPRPDNELRDR